MIHLLHASTAILLLLLLLFALGSQSVVIPHDFPDGVYELIWLADTKGQLGVFSYYDVPEANVTAVNFPGAMPLPVGERRGIDCLDTDMRLENVTEYIVWRERDARRAQNLLGNWCELYAEMHKDALVVAISGDMMWYVCNWDNVRILSFNHQRCAKREIADVHGRINEVCGVEERGELSIGPWLKTYGRSNRFGEICLKKDTW